MSNEPCYSRHDGTQNTYNGYGDICESISPKDRAKAIIIFPILGAIFLSIVIVFLIRYFRSSSGREFFSSSRRSSGGGGDGERDMESLTYAPMSFGDEGRRNSKAYSDRSMETVVKNQRERYRMSGMSSSGSVDSLGEVGRLGYGEQAGGEGGEGGGGGKLEPPTKPARADMGAGVRSPSSLRNAVTIPPTEHGAQADEFGAGQYYQESPTKPKGVRTPPGEKGGRSPVGGMPGEGYFVGGKI